MRHEMVSNNADTVLDRKLIGGTELNRHSYQDAASNGQ